MCKLPKTKTFQILIKLAASAYAVSASSYFFILRLQGWRLLSVVLACALVWGEVACWY